MKDLITLHLNLTQHCRSTILQIKCTESPTCDIGKLIQIVSIRMWVQSMALFSGLCIQHCPELWYRSQAWLGSHVSVAVG